MKNSTLRTPLFQSAMLLGGIIILFSVVASSGSNSTGGVISATFSGIGNAILFVFGMAIALAVSISVLIAIFLAAVAMVSPAQAGIMYSDLKKNFGRNIIAFRNQWPCCKNNGSGTGITEEDYGRMKQEIAQLHDQNNALHANISALENNKNSLQSDLILLRTDNESLKNEIEVLAQSIEALQSSETEINAILVKLTEKIASGKDKELITQINALEKLQHDAHTELGNLNERLTVLESHFNQPSTSPTSPTSGIFSYIENEEGQSLFIQKVEEALAEDMTYAQIDEYLTTNLPPEINTIIKDHPALTKNYIRNLRRE